MWQAMSPEEEIGKNKRFRTYEGENLFHDNIVYGHLTCPLSKLCLGPVMAIEEFHQS